MLKKVMSMVIPIMIICTSTSINGATAYAEVTTGTVTSSVSGTSTVTTTPAIAVSYTDDQGIKYSSFHDWDKTASVTGLSKDGYSENINIPKKITVNGQEYSVTSIDCGAFLGDSKLKSITIPDSIVSLIGNGGTAVRCDDFEGCSNLVDINVDQNNKNFSSVDGVLFNKDKTELIKYCQGKTQISYTIPSSVTSINDYAFSECKNIKSVVIPNSITKINLGAFLKCTNLTDIIIPDSVTYVDDSVFSGCSSITSITIPRSVTSIGHEVFSYCSNLTNVNVDANNKDYSSIEGVLFNKDKTNIIYYPEGNKQSSYTIPSSVITIDDSAFSHCSSLASITIPSSVTNICDYVFVNCSSLTSVTIPSSVTSIGTTKDDRCNYLNNQLGAETIFTSDGQSVNNAFQSDDGVLFYRTIATGTQASTGTVATATTQGAINTQGSTDTVAQSTTTATVATGTTSQTTKTGDASVLPVIAMMALGVVGIGKNKVRSKN